MAKKDRILKDKTDRLDLIPDEFNESVQRDQRQLNRELTRLVNNLQVENGRVLINDRNLAEAVNIVNLFRDFFFQSNYVGSVQEFADQFNVQRDLVLEYISEAIQEVSNKAIYQNVFQQAKDESIEALIGASNIENRLIMPIQNILNKAVGAGAGLTETIQNLNDIVIGGQTDGRLLRYTKQIAKDAFIQTDRNVTRVVSVDLGIEFFQYTGGLLDDSRQFCIARNANYYHHNEISEWVTPEGEPKPSGDWQGKIPETDSTTIFINAGGFNCNHSILPVSTINVPEDVLKRNIDNGNFNPSPQERALLGI